MSPIKHQKTGRIHKAALGFLLIWVDSTELPALDWIERQRKRSRPHNKSFQGRHFEAWTCPRAKVRKNRPALWQETPVPLQPPHNTPQPPCCHGYGAGHGSPKQRAFSVLSEMRVCDSNPERGTSAVLKDRESLIQSFIDPSGSSLSNLHPAQDIRSASDQLFQDQPVPNEGASETKHEVVK